MRKLIGVFRPRSFGPIDPSIQTQELDTEEQFDNLVSEMSGWGAGLKWSVLLDAETGSFVKSL